jgi:hypothetical protein
MDIAQGIFSTANALGINPIDLATAISYETSGTFNPLELGPETQFGQHRGLIQFGEPQANQYGVSFETRPQAISTQLGPGAGIYQYLKAVGIQPGMGLKQIYSAINTGGLNNFNMTDQRAGGMPGTVAEKVASMGDHRKNAQKFMELAMQNQPLNASPLLGPQNTNMPGNDQTSGMAGNPLFKMLGKTVGGGFSKLKDAVTGKDQDASDRLSIALMSLSGNPQQLQPMMALAAQDIKDRKTKRMNNKSLEYIRSVDPELAKLVENDPRLMQQVLSQAMAKQLGGNKTVMSAKELNEKFGLEVKPGAYNVVLDRNDDIVSYSATGQPNKNIFGEEVAKKQAARWSTLSANYTPARQKLADIELLERLLADVNTGPLQAMSQFANSFGIDYRSAPAAAAQALISRLVPGQRQPGSGPMSDADLDLFKQSLPALTTTVEGNQLIVKTMIAIGKYEVEVARIANLVVNEEISRQEGQRQLEAMNDPLAEVKAFLGTGGANVNPNELTRDEATEELS